MNALLVGLLLALTVGGPPPSAGAAKDAFAAIDESMRERVRNDGLRGGVVFVVRDGSVIHEASVGSVDPSTVIPIASASKWLTAATIMTLVDEGKLALDDPVAKYLPEFQGQKTKVRVRHLLSHTTGLAWNDCVGDPSTTTEACVDAIAGGSDPSTKPGKAFSYSSVGYEIAGRLVEVLTGQSFVRAFDARIATPLGMTNTKFDEIDGERFRHPQPAGSATSSVADYARFLAMLDAKGLVGDRRVLSEQSVAEIERDQVAGIDTRRDGAVQITGIPTYGLGVWRDVVGPDDEIRVVSGSGAYGFYPWIDRRDNAYGIIGVADLYHGSEHAVPISQGQARKSWRAAAHWIP